MYLQEPLTRAVKQDIRREMILNQCLQDTIDILTVVLGFLQFDRITPDCKLSRYLHTRKVCKKLPQKVQIRPRVFFSFLCCFSAMLYAFCCTWMVFPILQCNMWQAIQKNRVLVYCLCIINQIILCGSSLFIKMHRLLFCVQYAPKDYMFSHTHLYCT